MATSRLLQGNSEGVTEGMISGKNLTQVVDTIIEAILNRNPPKAADKDETSVGRPTRTPSVAQSSKGDTSTSRSSQQPNNNVTPIHRSSKKFTLKESDKPAIARRVAAREMPS